MHAEIGSQIPPELYQEGGFICQVASDLNTGG